VKEFGSRKLTQWRIAGFIAQAVPQKGCQKWRFEHRPSQTLVCFQERTAPHGKEKVSKAIQAKTVYP
jgi:hypothetical protein